MPLGNFASLKPHLPRREQVVDRLENHPVRPRAGARAIERLSTPKGIEEYLILLSVCQTCKYMGVDFLDFLRSGEKDIHAFAESRRSRRRQAQTSQTNQLPPSTTTDEAGGA
jgi:hypothetical protein